TLRTLAHAEEALVRLIKNDHLDLRHFLEAQDGIVGPGTRRDARAVEAQRFLEGPACRLDHAAFDLVDDAVGIDDLSDVDGCDCGPDADLAALALQRDL